MNTRVTSWLIATIISAGVSAGVVTCFSSTAMADDTISYVGWLNDSETGPVNDDIVADFALFAEEDGTESIWSEHYDALNVVDGWLVAELGSNTEFGESVDWGVETTLWLSITLDGEELLPREPITADPFLRQHASEVDDQLAALTSRVLALESAEVAWTDVTEKPEWVDELPADLVSDLSDGELSWDNVSGVPSILDDDTIELADISDLSDTLVSALGTDGALADGVHWSDLRSDPHHVEPRIHRDGTELYFDGFNISIRNGAGQTHEAKNGTGNLLIGYNRNRGDTLDRSGSHNLVVGDLHSFTSTGGVVSGINNTISEINAAAIGGESHIVTGIAAVAVGGETNFLSGRGAVSAGGDENRVAGDLSAIVGGFQNRTVCSTTAAVGGVRNLAGEVEDPSVWESECFVTASTSAVTVGGLGNYAGAFTAVVTGGQGGRADGEHSSVQGGRNNTASGEWAVVNGGRHNTASGEWSGVFGGGNEPTLLEFDEEGNLASGQGAVVVGGIGNSATHRNALVSGGQVNQADGPDAVVTGGNRNLVTGNDSVVVGGIWNNLSGDISVLLGGADNTLELGNRTHAGTCPMWKTVIGDDVQIMSTCDG